MDSIDESGKQHQDRDKDGQTCDSRLASRSPRRQHTITSVTSGDEVLAKDQVFALLPVGVGVDLANGPFGVDELVSGTWAGGHCYRRGGVRMRLTRTGSGPRRAISIPAAIRGSAARVGSPLPIISADEAPSPAPRQPQRTAAERHDDYPYSGQRQIADRYPRHEQNTHRGSASDTPSGSRSEAARPGHRSARELEARAPPARRRSPSPAPQR